MESVLGVVVYIDDILVTGQEHGESPQMIRGGRIAPQERHMYVSG